MGHYAKVRDGKVIKVIVADASFFNHFVDDSPGTWIKTSYNTRGGIHYQPNSNTPSPVVYYNNSGSKFDTEAEASASAVPPVTASNLSQELALRGNYAGIGYTYDSTLDAFYASQPFNSWTLNTGSFTWEAPTPIPEDGEFYKWDEDTLTWVSGSDIQ